MVNTQPLIDLLASSPMNPSLGPLMSYPSLTELTRNPAEVRLPIEKNWMFFFPGQESYLHYEISPRHGRSFAKLIGAGLTTNNLTDPLEIPCLTEDSVRSLGSGLGNATKMGSSGGGVWHQASNSLRLVLCERNDANCKPNDENTVFFAVAHQKYNNPLHLPLRYERYFIVWSAASPFAMLGVSRHPLLLANETATGWTAAQNREGDSNISDDGNLGKDQKGSSGWAEFTYTVSIAYAWGRGGDEAIWKNTGFLDDEVVLGIGIDDKGQGFASVKTRDLLQCLRACPGSR
ncbi:MAG: hypothetical protein M1819_004064 [Sarea resinae]|nr:MAG: hypothetical protein M1819_004064 [Sarea resinae]